MGNVRLTFILWLAILLSAFAVVLVTHQNRTTFIIWQGLIEESYRQDVEWGQLMLEKNTLASYARLQNIAVGQLDMVEPGGDSFEVVPMSYE